MGQAMNLLRAWHYVEFLTPYEIKFKNKAADVNYLRELTELPWQSTDKYLDTGKHTYTHQVYVGVFPIREELDFAREHFRETEVRPDIEDHQGKTALAVIEINNDGKYIEDSASISTMPFGLGQLNKGERYKDEWSTLFGKYKEEVKQIASSHLKGSIDYKKLQLFLRELLESSEWSPELINPPFISFTYRHKKDRKSEKEDILNSFFIRDLEIVEKAHKSGESGNALNQYLKGTKGKVDIDENREKIERILSPEHIPLAKWPSKDEYHLSMMQQLAVNSIFMKDTPHNNLYSVNGPPGTGKTTLLKDIMAENVFQRAKRMVKFSDPNKAFTHMKDIQVSEKFKVRVQNIDDSIRGYGMVVASSNNTAVENI
ncbi:hypothetical protein ACFOGI_02885 [Virgibacillus xinjiangensis]|uniref:DNA2/NAM7 helicase helicase domain-containing protein n=1 Tax=Virgibacillus xinjiangensis TaxID=393090 RepID=A0ABV7CSD3_9BACI